MKLKGIRKENSGTVHYEFEGDITIYTVNKLKDILTEELTNSRKIELDLHNVGKFDSAGFQLLIYMDREAKKEGKEINIAQKSMYVSKIFNLFGAEM